MKKHCKLLCALVMSTMVVSLFAGCGNSEKTSGAASQSKKIKIGVVLKALDADYWKEVKAGAMDAAKETGADVEVLGPTAETDIAGQTSMMEDEITKQVSALVVSPSQPDVAVSTFDKADAAGIPVVLIDTDANWSKKKSFLGTGNEAGGKVAGDFIASKLNAGDEVIMIRGPLGDATHDQRINGAKAVLAAKGIKILAIQPADSDMNKGMTVMENLLQVHPNIKAVYCSNDPMALGAERAIKQAGKKDIIVVGFNGDPDALTSILNGELTATVAQSAYDIGKMGVEAAVKVVKGDKIDTRIDTGTALLTKENAKEAQDNLKKILGQ